MDQTLIFVLIDDLIDETSKVEEMWKRVKVA